MTASSSFVAFIGIDWADQKHAVCLMLPSGEVEHSMLPQNAESIEAWFADLRQRFGDQPIAVCLEQSRGALIYALMQYESLVLYPVNPKQLADYRNSFSISGAKNDPGDATLLARLLAERHHDLRAWQPDDDVTRSLRQLVELRRKWVGQRTAHENQLTACLKQSYTLAFKLSSDGKVNHPKLLRLLKKFPTQQLLQRASPKQLERLLPRRRRMPDDPPAEELLKQRIAQIRQARPITRDAAVLRSGRLNVVQLVAAIEQLNESIAECEKEIEQLFKQHPDHELFAALPGAGEALAPRLLAAFGSDRERFESAAEVQQLSGIAPVTKQSGKSRYVQKRWACTKFLRQTFHEFAMYSVRYSDWARAFVKMKTDKGAGYHQAIRALAFKWIRILYRCWRTRQPYDEQRYLNQLRAKNAPLLQYLDPQPNPNT